MLDLAAAYAVWVSNNVLAIRQNGLPADISLLGTRILMTGLSPALP